MDYKDKIRINVYLSKKAIKNFRIMCIEKDTSVSKEINDFIIKATEEHNKEKENV